MSQFPLQRFVQNGGPQAIQLGGGFSSQASHIVKWAAFCLILSGSKDGSLADGEQLQKKTVNFLCPPDKT